MSNAHGPIASRINRYPFGLLDLLDTKAEGQTPHALDQTVQPTLELLPYYEMGKSKTATGPTTAVMGAISLWYPSTGAATPCIVPDTEFWHVQGLAFGLNGGAALAAGTTYITTGGWRFLRNGTSCYAVMTAVETTTAGQAIYWGTTGPVDFWASPGQMPFIHVRSVTLGTSVLGYFFINYTPYTI